jgi:Tfp pilus assembly protein PilX
MVRNAYNLRNSRRGVALIVAMIFIAIFGAFAAALVSMSSASAESASNQQDASDSLASAESGLECAKYLISTVTLSKTGTNTVSAAEANTAWTTLCTHVQTQAIGAAGVPVEVTATTIAVGSSSNPVKYKKTQNPNSSWTYHKFWLQFSRPANSKVITITSTGADGIATRRVGLSMSITKDAKVLQYAIASRGRMWITGDSTIHGSVYSAWNLSNSQLTQLASLSDQIKAKMAAGTLNSTSFATLVSALSLSSANRTTVLNELTGGVLSPEKAAARCIGFMSTSSLSVAPFNMTSDSTILGSINTCWTKNQVGPKSWQFETWDADQNPIYHTDGSGNVIYETDGAGHYLLDDNGEKIKARVVHSGDEIQGVCAGINYGEAPQNLAGMSIDDYDTTVYYNATRTTNGGGGDIPYSGSASQYTGNDASLASLGTTSGTKWRYEKFPHDATNYTTGSGTQVKRYIYKNQTFSNVRLPTDKNALFINCTFNNVLYVDAGKTTSNYNNVRFDNCHFNGTIVSNTPQAFNWQQNALYFTGSATFQNNTSAEATILAPHFNVNLGNANPVAGTDNVLRGAIVGGIVDVRGNAEVYGTIISMADTSSYTSGYVTNIGATLNDGGSETVAIGDIGTINVTPDQTKMLPSGITTPIIIKADQGTYSETM